MSSIQIPRTRFGSEKEKWEVVECLKRRKLEAEKGENDANVRLVVEESLKDIETCGEVAVRALSQIFDGYALESFRMTEQTFSKPDARQANG